MLKKAAKGTDPVEERRAARYDLPDTFGLAVDDFIGKHVSKQTERGQKESCRPLKILRQRWGDGCALDEITRQHILDYRNALIAAGTPYAAERAVTVLKTFFAWCVDEGYLDGSPASLVKSPFKKGERERKSRRRTLNDVEMREIWEACGGLRYPFGDYIKTLFLTAQRRSEVARMEWSEVNLDAGLWLIPGEKTKARREDHEVPLSSLAVEILRGLPRQEGPFVFSTTAGEKPISGFSKAKKSLDGLILANRKCEGEKRGEQSREIECIPDWRLHDIRRTATTELAALGVRELVYKLILNHSVPSILGITGTYNRYGYREEKRAALEARERRLMVIILEEESAVTNAVNLAGAHA